MFFFYVLKARESEMFHVDTEWAYKHLVIIVAVHKMDFEAVE